MNLIDAIQQPNLVNLSDDATFVYGNQTELNGQKVVVSRSSIPWTYKGVANSFGAALAEKLGAAIAQSGYPIAAQVYASDGLDLSLDQVQEQLTAIGAAFKEVTDLCNQLKAIGITYGTLWESWGIESVDTKQIAEARQRVTVNTWCANAINEVIRPMQSSGSSVADIKAAIASL